jgi:hypothetical protein
VSSFDYLSATLLLPLGTALVGPLAEALGAHATLLAMSALGVAAALAFVAVPSVRGLPRGG